MDRSLSILHLLSYHLFTGPVESVLCLAQTQLEIGHKVGLAVDTIRAGDIEERAKAYGVPIDQRFALSVKAGPILLLRDLLAFKRLWAEAQLDVLHAHLSHDHTLAALARPRKSKTALVRTLHTERAQRPSRDWQLKRADGLITVARKFRRALVQRQLVAEERVVSVEGTVDPELFCPGSDGHEVRKEVGINEHAPVAGIVARMKPDRGHDLLFKAWAQVVNRLPEARLLIAGRGELEGKLGRFVSRQPWADKVSFLGYRRDLARVYRAMDLKIILAPGNDGTCRAALQAMATGVCVVAMDQGALTEIVRDGQTGRVVPAGDAHALAMALVDLLSNREQLERMGLRARQEVLERFDRQKQAGVVEQLYRRVVYERDYELIGGGRK